MRHLSLILLVACAPKPPVVIWRGAEQSVTEIIEVRTNGDVNYTKISRGAPDRNERVSLTKEQVEELLDLLRTRRACELAHEPGFTPAPDEGQTSLELALPDQKCKVLLWNSEWQRGNAREIAETLRSMRPLSRQGPEPARKLRH